MTEAFGCRLATDDDHTDILDILEEVAPEIPVSLDTTQRKDAIKAVIVDCCASGESMVAVDGAGNVIGFVLAKPDHMERFDHDNQAVSLRYIGVGKGWRRRGVFAALLANYTAKHEPLTASVLHGNKSAMAARLAKAGFTTVNADSHETKLKRQP
jgi:N-acetylglutamate synthase-like GNAT family acetyltransferase